ncbi:MAG: hypothetical protein ACE5KZ_01670 [Candidatus Scalinduaceae bacterium]
MKQLAKRSNKYTKMKSLKRKVKVRKYNTRLTLMDLVTIFMDEANKVCKNKDTAYIIALKSLQDYISKHVSNIKII